MGAEPESERRGLPVDRRFLLAVLCAVLAAVVSWTELILVVPERVLPHWAVASIALLAAAALRIRPRSRPSGPWRAAFALPALVAVAGVGLGGAGDLGAEYRVLDPAGPDGCRALVRENSFLVIGDGSVYAVNGVGFALPSSSWVADDNARPIAAGQYELTWGERAGVLVLHGRGGDPVMPALHGVDCD
ncbi:MULTISPECIES: hypothetical protein [Streptomyces]|uniref:hypothetical protein n=1 Tax=Streptomyces TaxID=1883 RepID=UPI001671FE30|nr:MULTISPECIES: hypothetical protein [Streptomyces]MBD3580524.1 hypothetical protein [Streptomyces sp. KD18]GGT30322.1 hypothetical protein GCM10010286_64340 [Streptomyces toxytricini]